MFVTVGEIEPAERFSGVLNGQILTFLVGLPFFLATKPALTRTALIAILILGVFQLGISYVLYVQSTKYCPPLACNLLGALEPLLNPVWVFLFDGERPGLFALLGSVVVIVSIIQPAPIRIYSMISIQRRVLLALLPVSFHFMISLFVSSGTTLLQVEGTVMLFVVHW
jgi:hypothetical protein